MATKVRELGAKGRDGDKGACSICAPKPNRVPMWKVWKWSLAHPGEDAFTE